MQLVGRPKLARSLPKALPRTAVEALLETVAHDEGSRRQIDWAERDLAIIVTALLAGSPRSSKSFRAERNSNSVAPWRRAGSTAAAMSARRASIPSTAANNANTVTGSSARTSTPRPQPEPTHGRPTRGPLQ